MLPGSMLKVVVTQMRLVSVFEIDTQMSPCP